MDNLVEKVIRKNSIESESDFLLNKNQEKRSSNSCINFSTENQNLNLLKYIMPKEGK